MLVKPDPVQVVRDARRGVADARSRIAAASRRIRQAGEDCTLTDIPDALAGAQQALEAAWEACAFVDAMLAALAGEALL